MLAHGAKYHRDSWAPLARELVERGFRVLAIDFRYEDDPDAPLDAAVPALERDVLGAVRFLRADGATSVSVVGASLGGFAAGNAACTCDDGEIERVVLLAHAPIDAPARLKGRKLFVVARDDPGPDGAPRLDRIREQFGAASEPKQLLVLDGSAHAQALFDTDQSRRLTDAIAAFLAAP